MKPRIKPFAIFESVEQQSRLSKEVTAILNEQVRNELQSSQIYRGMSC